MANKKHDDNPSGFLSEEILGTRRHGISIKNSVTISVALGVLVVFILVLFNLPKNNKSNISDSNLPTTAGNKANDGSGATSSTTLKLTSDAAPWFYCDDQNRLYFKADEFTGEELVIPSKFDGMNVEIVNGESFAVENDTAKKLIVGNGIKQLGRDAFSKFSALSEVSLPETIIRVSGRALHNTPWYESQTEEFLTVGDGVLIKYNGTSETVTIPDTVKIIDCETFMGLDTATKITLPATTSFIGSRAFAECTANDIVISDGVNYIQNDAFKDSAYLKRHSGKNLVVGNGCMISYEVKNNTITVPDNVLQMSGFDPEVYDGENLMLHIGKSVAKVDNLTQLGFVKEYSVSEGNIVFSTIDGVLYNRDATYLYKYPVYREGTSYAVSKHTKHINDEAFTNSKLEQITLPISLESIGDQAFEDCKKLLRVTIPTKTKQLGTNLFRGCKSLKSCVIPDETDRLPYGIFRDCEKLTEVTVPQSVLAIRGHAFAGCKSLKKFTVNTNIILIEETAFENCSNIVFTVEAGNKNFFTKDGELRRVEKNVKPTTPTGELKPITGTDDNINEE